MIVFLWFLSQLMILASLGVLLVLALIAVVWTTGRVARLAYDRATGQRRRHARPRLQRRSTRVDPFPDVAPPRALEVPPMPDTPPVPAADTQPIPRITETAA